MASLLSQFDKLGEHYYETGVDHGVLYVKKTAVAQGDTPGTGVAEYETGVVWNGLSSVSLTPEGADPNDIYADNIKYLSILGIESINATVEAYQSPAAFDACDGSAELVAASGVTIGQQPRKSFALCFRTKISNDANLNAYKLHILYGCLATPADRDYETINESPDAMTLSWDITTVPVAVNKVAGAKATALVTIDSRKVDATKLKAIEDKLYGTDAGTDPQTDPATDPVLLLPDEIFDILSAT